MLAVIAILLAILILTGKGVGWLVGNAWDLLWLVVIVLVIWWLIRGLVSSGPHPWR